MDHTYGNYVIIGSCLLVKKIMQEKAITNVKTALEIFQVIQPRNLQREFSDSTGLKSEHQH